MVVTAKPFPFNWMYKRDFTITVMYTLHCIYHKLSWEESYSAPAQQRLMYLSVGALPAASYSEFESDSDSSLPATCYYQFDSGTDSSRLSSVHPLPEVTVEFGSEFAVLNSALT